MNTLKNLLVPSALIFSLALLRLVPHMPNFAPISAMALFGAVYVDRRYAFVIPLIAMMISDYLLLYINPFGTPFFNFSHLYAPWALYHSALPAVYGSFAISGLIGLWLKRHTTPITIVGASFLCSVQFFLITNGAVWLGGAYGAGFSGLMASYIAGIPFFQGTMLGDFFYTASLFGAYELLLAYRRRPVTFPLQISTQ